MSTYRRLSGRSFLFSLLLPFAACQKAPPPAKPPAATVKVGAVAGAPVCQRSEKVEGEPPYVVQLSALEELHPESDLCISEQTLKTVSTAVLDGKSDAAALPLARWDHKSTPARLSLIEKRFPLSAKEREQLLRSGFVVPARLYDTDYVMALHEVFQSQLPLYVSADAILHAVYASNDKLLAQLEVSLLAPRLDKILEALHCALETAARGWPNDVAYDVDLYLTVARSLLSDKAVASIYGQNGEAKALIEKVKAAGGLTQIPLFGRPRMIDFSVYAPRGHYATEASKNNPGQADLSAYFRAATWLSRIEWNIVSRSCVSSHHGPEVFDTPHETAVALALGRLIAEAKMTGELDAMDRAWSLLAGKREDVPLSKLVELATGAGLQQLDDAALATKLRNAVGKNFARTARTHYAWEGCTDLPAISTMLGPRVVADAAATRPLVHGETTDRRMLHAADMAYALGHDRALNYLTEDLQKYPQLRDNLNKARKLAQSLSGNDLYTAWSTAIHRLADQPGEGAIVPSFMQSEAYSDLRINSAVAAFGQIRHNYVLMAAQTYDEGGCAIPDGFVEPVPAVYDALIAYAERGTSVLATLDPKDSAGGVAYFARLSRTLRILSKIARAELANRALTSDEKNFLSMVVEVSGNGRGTGGSPTFTGWYFDLFRDRRDAFAGAGFIADYYASTEAAQVAYAGVASVRLGIFIVDTAGEPRAFVGPVARAYEHVGALEKRLNDADGYRLKDDQRVEPWAASYTVKAPAEPPLTFIATVKDVADPQRTRDVTLQVWSTRALGPVTIDLLDHHRQSLGRVTHPVGTTKTKFHFPSRPVGKGGEYFGYEGVHIQVGEFHAWEVDVTPDAQSGAPRRPIVSDYGVAYGGMPAVPPLPASPEFQ